MDRRERKWRAKEYHENPVNSWVNVYKGVLLALLTYSVLEHACEFAWTYWTNL